MQRFVSLEGGSVLVTHVLYAGCELYSQSYRLQNSKLKILSPGVEAPMGISIPAAIGAVLSCNADKTVVAVTSPQSLLMTGLELTTAMAMR